MFLDANEWCEAEVSANSVVCGRIPAPDTRAEQSTALARSWFDRCQNDHDLCKSRSQGGVLPTRVIDVRDFQNSGQVTLVRGQEASGQYVAFSHRWMPGTPDTLPWVTTTLNEATRQQGFRASVLPHGIRDAITCTARLGIRYLWIDSLCILQDPAGDWERESVKMLDVFGNAAITLFADCSENDGFQFLKPRDTGNFQDRRGTEFGIEVECGSKMQIQILERYSRYQPRMPAKATDLFQSNVIGSSLSDRGWIFQEQVISSRRLHFGHHQMFWSCEQSFEAEDGTDLTHTCVPPHWYRWLFSPKYARRTGLDSHFGISDGQMEIWVQHVNWAMLVENYTRRSLTKGSDKLRALSALAKAFGVIYNDKYVVGNWAKCFRLNLLWSAKPRAGATTKTTKPCKAPYKEPHLSGSPIPSWSWLAADG
ncbi:heterokaryon incompatibility protein-domain-containing protein, partial [Diaporthe sp. PMI_573]